MADFDRIAEVMRLIQADTEADVLAFEGAPFTGKTVAEMFGNLSAAVNATAKAIEALASAQAALAASEGVA